MIDSNLDPQGMLTHVLNLPQTCADAWELAARTCPQLGLSDAYAQVRHIVVVGMGGSAIGGDLLAALVADECPCPILVQRGYELPAFVRGPDTLVIAASYSGNTEETLSAFRQARDRGALLLALSTGGELARLCDAWRVPLIRFSYPSQPRAALGYSLAPLVYLLGHLGLIADRSADMAEAVKVMRAWQAEIGPDVPLERNLARRLAGQLTKRLPVVYGAGWLEPVARRWKTQFNENAKEWAFFEGLPELNHNAVVGYGLPDVIRQGAMVVILRSKAESPRIQARWRVTRELLRQEGVATDQVEARGASRLAQMLSLIHLGDLVSVYMAYLNQVDPTPVAPIAYLKAQLAQL